LFEPYFLQNPQMRQNWATKVFPLAGDLTLSGLGLTAEHREILLNEV
jgi:hypothetical protein